MILGCSLIGTRNCMYKSSDSPEMLLANAHNTAQLIEGVGKFV